MIERTAEPRGMAPEARRPRTLVLATRNMGKVSEFRDLLKDLDVEVRPISDYPGTHEVEEDGDTFEKNAIKKARAAAEQTGEIAMADDSGLEVDALGGEPGVHSARYSGGGDAANCQKLLSKLEGVPDERRTARFKCVVAIATPHGEVHTASGSCEGYIAREPRGTRGFGYDPVFVVPEFGKTFAELTEEEKNLVSHRARAVEAAKETLKRMIEGFGR